MCVFYLPPVFFFHGFVFAQIDMKIARLTPEQLEIVARLEEAHTHAHKHKHTHMHTYICVFLSPFNSRCLCVICSCVLACSCSFRKRGVYVRIIVGWRRGSICIILTHRCWPFSQLAYLQHSASFTKWPRFAGVSPFVAFLLPVSLFHSLISFIVWLRLVVLCVRVFA